MRYLVTGGAGFIGSNLCEELLKKGHEVFCLDNLSTGCIRNIEPLQGHTLFHWILGDVQACGYYYVDAIYHLASPASPEHYNKCPIETIEANVWGTKAVLELARKLKVKVVYTSTSEVYGDPKVHPQDEEYTGNVDPTGLRACYDESKRCGETLCSVYWRQFGVDARIVRIFNTYGPNLNPYDGRVISNFIVKALRGEPLIIYGDGTQTRSFQYVSDLVEGLQKVMEAEENYGPINLGRPEEYSIKGIAEMIIKETGSSSKIEYAPLPPGDPIVRKPNIEKAQRVLDWSPEIPFEDGLEVAVDYFKGLKEEVDYGI